MGGREVPILWNGRRARAWVPDLLAARDLSLTERTTRGTERAAALARRSNDQLPRQWEALGRLLLRTEGVASSFIEGVGAPLVDVAVAELDPAVGEHAAWVADNLKAVQSAVGEAQEGPLRVRSLHRWHGLIMRGTRHLPPRLVGTPRKEQGWIGGTSPLDAALVTPPPDAVERLLTDLVEFVNRTDVDPVTQAAVAHAQFEVIHPYADGNGRVGRVLVGWVLSRRLGLVTPPPVSVRIATDRGGYLAGLTHFRLGQADPWVAWFADVVGGAGEASINLVHDVQELQAQWTDRLTDVRTDATARQVLSLLPQHPVLGAATVADALDVSERAGRAALETLARYEIVERFDRVAQGRGRPRKWWVAPELIALVSAWSR
ncbi:MAG TPA: Fic family protein [Acidimicrobiales bacterium]|nr:Fic family protein [Acidimicrobiales bacterium]